MNSPSERTLEALRSPLGEQAIRETWLGIAKRRDRTRVHSWTGSLGWALVGASLAVVVLVVLQWPRQSTAGALRLADGSTFQSFQAPLQQQAQRVVFSDGSSIAVDPGTTVTALSNGSSELSLIVSGGRALFEVQPKGQRKWTLSCGVLAVEVMGTTFELQCTEGVARVVVHKGWVRVRELAGQGTREVGPGDRFEVVRPAESASGTATQANEEEAAKTPTAQASANTASPTPAASALGSWRELAAKGRYQDAYSTLGSEGLAREAVAASLDDLLALADVARLSGHHGEAARLLEMVLAQHGSDPRAAVAAFTLGRIYLGPLGRPSQAAVAFSRALTSGLPGALREDAQARLVEARSRAGDLPGARLAAQQYQQQYPQGRYLDSIAQWVGLTSGDAGLTAHRDGALP